MLCELLLALIGLLRDRARTNQQKNFVVVINTHNKE